MHTGSFMKNTKDYFKLRHQASTNYDVFMQGYDDSYNKLTETDYEHYFLFCNAAAYTNPFKFEYDCISNRGINGDYFWGKYYLNNLSDVCAWKLLFEENTKQAVLWAGKTAKACDLFYPPSMINFIIKKMYNTCAFETWRKYHMIMDDYEYFKLKLGWENDPILTKPDIVGKAIISFGTDDDMV